MLSVAEALSEIVAHVRRLPPTRLPLADALGLVLADDVVSDLDSPPFDKALMDGYAVRAADVVGGRASLRMIEEVLAGQVPRHAVASGEAIRIMTGAPLPSGADAVIPVEHTQFSYATAGAALVSIETKEVVPGTNVLHRGASTRQGTRVLPCGRQIRPQETGCLAELGKATVAVYS